MQNSPQSTIKILETFNSQLFFEILSNDILENQNSTLKKLNYIILDFRTQDERNLGYLNESLFVDLFSVFLLFFY